MSAEPEPALPACRRVGLVVDEDALARFAPVIRLLAVGLIDALIKVTVIGPPGKRLADVEWGPVRRVEHGSFRWLSRRRTLGQVLDDLAEETPDVIHGLTGWSELLVKELAAALGVPAVLSLTSLEEIASASVGAAAVIRRWVATSTVLEEQARQQFASAAGRLHRVPLGLVAQDRPCCFCHDQPNPVLICRCTLTPTCGVSDVLQVLRELLRDHPGLMLLILGTGPAERAARRQVQSLGLREAVTFVGSVPQGVDPLHLADIFVDPTAENAMQIAGLQAMAAGLAVVAAEGGVADHYKHEHTALTYPRVSAATLKQHLSRLITDPSFAQRLAGQGQAYVREHHKASQMSARLAEIYCDLARTARATGS